MTAGRLLCFIVTRAALLALGMSACVSHGADSAPVDWINPVIEGYGRIHPDADLPIRPEPGVDYKILADVIHPNADPAKISTSLDRLARLVNLFGYAGVMPDHVHIVAVLDESNGLLALGNVAYHQRFKVDNPNLELLHLLKTHGVILMVCSQAMAEHDLKAQDFTPDATVTLSALTDLAVFGQRGYSYLQL